jgi:CYTH domain-containing protein
MEIERKFMPDPGRIPDNLKQYSSMELVQGYLCTEPVVRVRKEGSDYVLTYKGAGLLSREEYNLPLTAGAFETLLKKCDGRIIEKTRYRIPLPEKGLTAELDVFAGDLQGLIYVEVEFPSENAALSFVPPDWFGREVTSEPGFSNSALSRGADPRKKVSG